MSCWWCQTTDQQKDVLKETIIFIFLDAGTEIAFVLDGSGSISPEDFIRAKDFIYNVMFKVWNACFNASIN